MVDSKQALELEDLHSRAVPNIECSSSEIGRDFTGHLL